MANANENIDMLMAKNLTKQGKTLHYGLSKQPIPFSETVSDRMTYQPPPKPLTKTRPSVAQPSMVTRSFQDYMRSVHGLPGKQQPRIPGMLGPASLFAALAPEIKDQIMFGMGLNTEGLEDETWFNPEGSSYYIDEGVTDSGLAPTYPPRDIKFK